MAERRNTVVVSGVPEVLHPGRMVDKLTIHFQSRRRSHGGDVKVVEYPTEMDGVAFVTFDRAEDAERVVRKEQHTMVDEEFTQDYVLTVFPFSRDVFLYVPRATLDLSVFGSSQASLIKSLRSSHRSIHFQALPHQRKASIEGPFSAVRALREDLIHRASVLRPSSETKVVKPRETSPHPSLAFKNSTTSHGGTKAKQEAANSSGLLQSALSTGTNREVLLSEMKSPKASFRQKASNESLAGGSFRQADGEEMRTAVVSSSELKRLHVEETVAKQQRDDGCSQQLRSLKISATHRNTYNWKDPGSPMRNHTFRHNDPRKGSNVPAKTPSSK